MAKRARPVLDRLPRCIRVRRIKLPTIACRNPLAFTMQHQEQTQWCWSATSVSVNLFYHPASGWTQCSCANATLGQTTCCTAGNSAQCNTPFYLDLALKTVANFKSMSGVKAALSRVRTEIRQCRPLCLRIGWNGGGGHFVAVYGYSGTNINIGDPWYGDSVVSYGAFPSSYNGGGTWTHTYFTKA